MSPKDALSIIIFPIGIARLYGMACAGLNRYYDEQEANYFDS